MSDGEETQGPSLDDRISHYDDSQAPIRAMLALDAGRMGSWCWNIPDNTVTGDPFVAQLLNLDFDAQPWALENVFTSMHPEDLPKVQAEVDKALSGADLYEVEFRDRIVDPDTGEEGLRWLGARGNVTKRAETGEPLEMIGVNWDVTEHKILEERLAMLADEMDHRVKNAFAVIRALINLGQRTAGDKNDFAGTLKAQVQAMADAHAISAKMARQEKAPSASVPILRVLETALMPWLPKENGAKRDDVTITIDADESIAVEPTKVSAIAMLIYELATNAAKYGPLGESGGSLDITLSRRDDEKAVLRWIERTDNPALDAKVEVETREGVASGFGSMLIQHCTATLRARVKRELTENGLHFEIQMPLAPIED